MTPYEFAVFGKAIRKYGAIHQIIKAVEEMSELTKELCKYLDMKPDVDHIAEEIADVEITIEQLKMILDCEQTVENWRIKKVKRLEERIKVE